MVAQSIPSDANALEYEYSSRAFDTAKEKELWRLGEIWVESGVN